MDLPQQLVIWKKARYLMDNLLLKQEFLDILVDEDVLTLPVVNEMEKKLYNTDKVLVLLTALGSSGTEVFSKFINALKQTDQITIAKELLKTKKFTHFGEMLPPQFTYFMDMSEFLKLYPHLAIKLGEDSKHLVQSFIDGKIDVEVRKNKEYLSLLERKNAKLKTMIHRLKSQKSDLQTNLAETQTQLKEANIKVESLKARNEEMEIVVRNKETEVKMLKHFRFEMEDLDKYLEEEYREALDIFKSSNQKQVDEDNKEVILPSDPQWLFLLSQVKLLTDKFYHSVVSLDILEKEEQELTKLQNKAPNLKLEETESTHGKHSKRGKSGKREKSDLEEDRDINSILINVRKNKLKLKEEVAEISAKIDDAKMQLQKRGKAIKAKHDLDDDINNIHVGLQEKLRIVSEQLKRSYIERLREERQKYDREQNGLIQRMRDMNDRHWHEIEKYKNRVRNKIVEINRREALHKKLKNQITVLERYEAKNMNATVPVEECRKIVRSIINDARLLKAIAEEREIKQTTFEPLNEAERNELERKKELEEKKKAKKKKKKKFDGLAEDRLAFLAEHIQDEWREFAKKLGVSNNRLDLVEIDHPTDNNEKLAFYMLIAWRDEELGGGKVSKLIEALEKYGRSDLTYIVVPKKALGQEVK